VPGKPFGVQLADQVKALPRAELKGFMVESCIGSYPLEVVARPNSPAAESPPAPGSFAVLWVELSLHGVPWLGAAPGFVESS
jgi:hypothetical protein